MSQDKPHSPFFDFAPTSAPEESLAAIDDPTVRGIAGVFAKNFDDVAQMFGFPVKLAYACLSGQREMITFMQACMKGNLIATKYGQDPEMTRKIDEEMANIRAGEGLDWISAEARKLLPPLLRDSDIAEGVRVFLYSLLSASWTTFETMAADLWTACVSARPSQLGNQVIFSLPRKTRWGAEKYVSLRFLSKHNFDLRNSLGSVLGKKFDFTSLSGIAKAYKSAFAGFGSVDIFGNSDLKLLQAYRHAIVHRAGIADQSFLDTAGLRDVTLGSSIPLDDHSVERMINSAGTCGSRLIVSVDEWLSHHPM